MSVSQHLVRSNGTGAITMGDRKRGRRPPVVMPDERRQFQPQELVNTLAPILRQNLQRLAAEAYKRKGRGGLIAEINHRLPTGVARVDYARADELEQYATSCPRSSRHHLSRSAERITPRLNTCSSSWISPRICPALNSGSRSFLGWMARPTARRPGARATSDDSISTAWAYATCPTASRHQHDAGRG